MKGEICSSDVMKAIKQSVAGGKISPELKNFFRIRCRLYNLSSIMVQYLNKVSLNFHQHNIKLDYTIISTHTCMIQKETW